MIDLALRFLPFYHLTRPSTHTSSWTYIHTTVFKELIMQQIFFAVFKIQENCQSQF